MMHEAKSYRKKPVVIEAMQWSGDNQAAVEAFVGIMENMDGDVHQCRFIAPDARMSDDETERVFTDGAPRLWVEANLSWLPIEPGEWILKDRLGFYPCKNVVFADTYERVS